MSPGEWSELSGAEERSIPPGEPKARSRVTPASRKRTRYGGTLSGFCNEASNIFLEETIFYFGFISFPSYLGVTKPLIEKARINKYQCK